MAEERSPVERYSFVLTTKLEDLLSAHAARQKLRPFYKFRRILMVILIAAIVLEIIDFGILLAISVLARKMSVSPLFDDLIKIGAIMLGFLILILGISILNLDETIVRWRFKHLYRTNQAEHEAYEIVVDPESVQMNLKDWKTWIGWSRIEGIYAYREGFLIFTSDRDYFIVPNHVVEEQVEIEAFKDFLAQVSRKPVDEIE